MRYQFNINDNIGLLLLFKGLIDPVDNTRSALVRKSLIFFLLKRKRLLV